ncbi:MAG TPA: SDR family NAD(P)-dependent oxidoreductase [Caulobacteraceae bacterium]|jgi:NAD(P)-dependent dehydrogenase (short-subunit alcohol dehydrogenase family)
MKDLNGKVAFITGGASGIGLAMARAFGREGMLVMIADIEAQALQAAVDQLRSEQVRAEGVVADVTRRDSLRAAALETIARFGKVHVVCNNAGVGAGGMLGQVPERDWNWVVDVNLYGVVHGMEIFTPLILSHGEGGHFVNTASMAGLVSPPGMEPYCATKYAVLGMSEGWAQQLAPQGVGVSVLCPGFVKTRIHESRRNRTDAYGADERAPPPADAPPSPVLSGIDVQPVGDRVAEAVKANELYVFTHPEFKAAVAARFERILEAFDSAAASPALAVLPKREMPGLNLAGQRPAAVFE